MSVAILFIVALISKYINKIIGEGPVISKSYNLTNFTVLDTCLDADIYYKQAKYYAVDILAQQNIHAVLEARVISGRLRIQFDKYKNVRQHSRIAIFVTAPELSSLGVNCARSLRIHNLASEILSEI